MEALLFVIAAVIALALNHFLVPTVFHLATKRPAPPEGIDHDRWSSLIDAGQGGEWIGRLETLLALAAFWNDAYILVAGWLAFKVAAKWESWKNITQVPARLENVNELDWLVARHDWGTHSLKRFLIGTVTNINIAILVSWILGP